MYYVYTAATSGPGVSMGANASQEWKSGPEGFQHEGAKKCRLMKHLSRCLLLTPGALSVEQQDLLAMLSLAACVVVLFWRVCFTHAMFFYRDVFNYTYPTARLIHELCRQGHLPYWNPYVNFGQELLANPN